MANRLWRVVYDIAGSRGMTLRKDVVTMAENRSVALDRVAQAEPVGVLYVESCRMCDTEDVFQLSERVV